MFIKLFEYHSHTKKKEKKKNARKLENETERFNESETPVSLCVFSASKGNLYKFILLHTSLMLSAM